MANFCTGGDPFAFGVDHETNASVLFGWTACGESLRAIGNSRGVWSTTDMVLISIFSSLTCNAKSFVLFCRSFISRKMQDDGNKNAD